MKRSGAKQPQNEKVLYGVLGVVVLGCLVYVYLQFAGPSTPPPPAAPVIRTTAAATSTVSTATMGAPVRAPAAGVKPAVATGGTLDPALHMEAMLVTEGLEYAGSGRNIFSTASAPPKAPPAPKVVAPLPVANVAPMPVMPSGPPMPPPPPPIDLKFFGTATAQDGRRTVFLLHGEDVYHAMEGEVVARRYKVITIGAKSVVIEDLPNSNRQTIPLEAQ